MGKDWHPVWDAKAQVWKVDFQIDGQRFRKRLGIRDKGLAALARQRARAYYLECWQRHLDPAPPVQLTLFYAAAEGYVKSGGEARFLPKLMAHFGPNLAIEEIGEAEITAAAHAIYPDCAPDTIRRQVRVPINAVIRWSRGERRRPSTDVRRTRWLTPEEVRDGYSK